MNVASDNGMIRGLNMDHYVLANDEFIQPPSQPQPQPIERTPSDEFTEAIMIDNRRKSCSRSTMDDVGYLCGCGTSPVDDAEVVYIKRTNGGPKNNTDGTKQVNFLDQREDASTARHATQMQHGQYREVNMDDLRYSSPRVGCMPGGVADLLMPGCRPNVQHHFREEKPMENPVPRDENIIRKNNTNETCDKKENYDEWKKQLLDEVKLPSLSVGVTEPTNARIESNQRSHVPTAEEKNNVFRVAESSDYKVTSDRAPYQGTHNHYPSRDTSHVSVSDNDEYSRWRPVTQPKQDVFRHHSRDIPRTRSELSTADASLLSYERKQKGMIVNQKFNEVMGSFALPKSTMYTGSSAHILGAHDHASPQSRMSHLSSPPSVLSDSYAMNIPANHMSQRFHPRPISALGNDYHSIYPGGGTAGAFRSPTSPTVSNMYHHGFERDNPGMIRSPLSDGYMASYDRPNYRDINNFGLGNIPPTSPRNVQEEALDEMKLKSLTMEADLIRLKESIGSPKSVSSPKYYSHRAPVTSPASRNGFLPSDRRHF